MDGHVDPRKPLHSCPIKLHTSGQCFHGQGIDTRRGIELKSLPFHLFRVIEKDEGILAAMIEKERVESTDQPVSSELVSVKNKSRLRIVSPF